MPENYVGIDWGTHSSKWCYQDSGNQSIVGRLWDSHVWRIRDSLAIFPIQSHYRGESGESALKRRLIYDPDQPFWDGRRPKLGVTLGEAVVFSLLCILSDAAKTIKRKGIDLDEGLTLRFSHPNWVIPDRVMALQYYRDATVVAISALREMTPVEKDDSLEIRIEELREIVARNLPHVETLEKLPPSYDHEKYETCLKGSVAGFQWQFVFESCAAGFPYLMQAEPEVFDSEGTELSEKEWVRKILVVDIGAGSTDFGYMLRTLQLDPQTHKRVKPLLIWLPAAPAFERAGNWLTDRIYEDWVSQGRPTRTRHEAEDYKTSGVTDWYGKEYVTEWCDSIARAVADYGRAVPDAMRLPKPPPLQVVITGGSSAVPPIRQILVDGVKSALKSRGIQTRLSEETGLLESSISTLRGGGYSDVQCAQLAVCFGASHPRLTELKHYPQGLK